jgi:hypothetical protein
MPPTSVNIFEEGANIHSFKIVNNGVFDRKGLLYHMVEKPASYPGNSGCRNIRDVESDLKAVSAARPLPYLVVMCLNMFRFLANLSKPQRNPTDSRP